jgi:hypothetical protein
MLKDYHCDGEAADAHPPRRRAAGFAQPPVQARSRSASLASTTQTAVGKEGGLAPPRGRSHQSRWRATEMLVGDGVSEAELSALLEACPALTIH